MVLRFSYGFPMVEEFPPKFSPFRKTRRGADTMEADGGAHPRVQAMVSPGAAQQKSTADPAIVQQWNPKDTWYTWY